ncbi:GroES-like protein [Agrocybe pediades]|nr:GroES-like protein [Agrocybe pediades]
MPSTQKALFLEKKFGEFVIRETGVYTPGPGELLVKIKSTSLNPADWKIQKNGILVQEFPAILGSDIAGDVEEVGEGVKEFKKGDRVFAHGAFEVPWASFQQFVLVRAEATSKIPENVTYDEASSLPVALTTAYVGLYNSNPYGMELSPPTSGEALNKYSGTPFVVLGASSSVGQVALQLARISGFSPIITTASSRHTESLNSLGATHVLDRNLPRSDLVAEVKRIAGNKTIQYVYDGVSTPETQQAGLDILAPGGQLVIVLFAAVKIPKDKTVIKVFGRPLAPENVDLVNELYHNVIYSFLEKGLIKGNNTEALPDGLAGIPGGLERLAANQVSGLKLVAHPQETAQSNLIAGSLNYV